MRKITQQTVLDTVTFEPVVVLVVREEDGSRKMFREKMQPVSSKYFQLSAEQRAIIESTNIILGHNGEAPIQDEEVYYLITGGLGDSADPSDAELQQLSGFEVVKTIKEFSSRTPESDEAVNKFRAKQEEYRQRREASKIASETTNELS